MKLTHRENGILGTTAGAHWPTLFSLRGPAKALHQRAREAPEFSGWVGGWMGGWVGGDHLGPSIFLIFKYVNKQHVLIPEVDLKVAYAV